MECQVQKSMISFLIPFHSNDPYRIASMMFARDRIINDWPNRRDQVLVGDNPGPFNRSTSRNHLVKHADGDVFVFSDSDSLVPLTQLVEGVRRVVEGESSWCFPYDLYCSANESSSRYIMGDHEHDPAVPIECDYVFPSKDNPEPSHGGCLIMSRPAYMAVGGYDERFIGWGEEDRAIFLSLNTLVHPEVRVSGRLIHLWHPAPEEECFGQPHFNENRALCNRYREAEGNPAAMRALVREHS